MATDTDPHELSPLSAERLTEEPTKRTGATLKDIALAVDQIRVQFHDLASEVPHLASKLEMLHNLVMEHANDWMAIATKVDQHEVRIRKLEVCMPGECRTR